MGLSNYYPSSRLSQAGVCTSSTRPASPYEGQMIYETDTNKLLVYDGSAWLIPNQNTTNVNGLELIYSSDFSALQNVEVPAGTFSSTYSEYKLYLRVDDFVGTGVCWLQLGTNSTYETSGYRWAGMQSYSDSPITAQVQSSGAIGFLMQNFDFDNVNHKKIGTSIDIFNPFEATYTTASNITYVGINPQYYGRYLFHKLSTSTSYNRCRIQYSGTSITGSIRVYGYRK